MVDQVEFLMSLISIIFHLFNTFRKAISMSSLPLKKLSKHHNDASVRKVHPVPEDSSSSQTQGQIMQPDLLSATRDIRSRLDVSRNDEGCLVGRSMVEIVGSVGVPNQAVAQAKVASKLRKRPTMIIVPESGMVSGFGDASRELDSVPKEFEVEGSEYCLVSRKGTRHAMEDGYEMITNIHGDPKQAFFGVYDGHGGRAAVDFVCEKLGKNIITGISQIEGEGQIELAIRDGYLATDKEFLSKGLKGGACTATVLLRNGELHASNVGDSRVVISRKGIATALTCDHRAGREDEVVRIESSGGYVTCRNGVTRVHDSLAVSRAIGDANMKEWIISEPETENLRLTPDCEFLIMASDGLWDKVSNQEAVDVVSRHKNSMKSCRELVDISSIRGSRDDITVMVVDLQRFVQMGS